MRKRLAAVGVVAALAVGGMALGACTPAVTHGMVVSKQFVAAHVTHWIYDEYCGKGCYMAIPETTYVPNKWQIELRDSNTHTAWDTVTHRQYAKIKIGQHYGETTTTHD